MRNAGGKAVLAENAESLGASAWTQKHEPPLMQGPSSGVYALLSWRVTFPQLGLLLESG